ncbi:unnamed protein product, partial [marine sediment metagenome]
DEFLCENCCINSSILEIFRGFERLSEENQELHEELDELKETTPHLPISHSHLFVSLLTVILWLHCKETVSIFLPQLLHTRLIFASSLIFKLIYLPI